ncbi:site-specific integrase [Pseudoduganella sp. FT93W]|uniref:Site-specific integrase n=1 Tax=Duganella fentianensis TaxID=2692177 RepID=A0A845I0G0_9BURK|nr:site-specific integrase [Duganella fentianensis]MYN46773.1 site-specific integrase [Duganella fentianensis]
MSFTVYYSDPEVTSKAGFAKVANLPCIFDSRPGYHRLASAYLIDRGLGYWNPSTRGQAPALAPSDQTIKNYAQWLANFLEWAEVRNIDLKTCTYVDHVHGRYQKEMEKGTWSRDGRALKDGTVNPRVQQACDYLMWMSDKGHRPSFHIPTHTATIYAGTATSSIGHRAITVEVRDGKARKNKRALRLPSDAEVKEWLEKVYHLAGYAKGLMCELVLLSALRRSEAAGFRVDTLPEERAAWHLNDPSAPRANQRVRLEIKFGTKGPDYGYDHGDKIGPKRQIWIPLELAERIHAYRQKTRNVALKKWVKSAPTLTEQRRRIDDAVHLFLDEDTGERITGKALYNAWTAVELPYAGWSPHLGRDYWACSILWKEVTRHEEIKKLFETGSEIAQALLESTAMSIIRLQIQPQLGHANASTSMIYLEWICNMFGVNLSIDLDRGDENELPVHPTIEVNQ